MTENLLFNLGLAFILIHEMDAVRCKEWRIFPGLNLLNDRYGAIIFLLAHIPLLSLLFIGLDKKQNNDNLIFYLEIFFIIHLIIHLLYLKNSKNEFKDFVSWTFIIIPAFVGLIDLIIK
jgi:Family of unknown function (DUF6713)